MKSVYFLIFLISVSLSIADEKQKWNQEKRKFQQQCKSEVGVDEESFESMVQSGRANESERKEVLFVYCMALKEGFFDNKGNLKTDNLNQFLKKMKIDDDLRKETMEACKKVEAPSDKASAANKYYNCFADHLPRDVLIL